MTMSNCLHEHLVPKLCDVIVTIFVDRHIHIWHRKHIRDILSDKPSFGKKYSV